MSFDFWHIIIKDISGSWEDFITTSSDYSEGEGASCSQGQH